MKRTILIVDDERINREILKKILKEEYLILEAANGQEAMDVMRRNSEHLSAVLLDIVMPVMDGYETLSKVRNDAELSQIPVIVITGSTEETARIRALSLGASDFMLKPFSPEIIFHCVRNNIALRETTSIVNTMRIDKLSGLYNQDAFFELAEEQIQRHESGYFTLSLLNIDNFKVINDEYGRKTGDLVLQHVSRCIRETLLPIGGICCRMMGDRFAMLFHPTGKRPELIDYFHRTVVKPDCIDQPMTVRVGRYVVTDLSLPVSAMCDRAALAGDSIKGKYGLFFAVFDESMHRGLIEEQQIVNEMSEALRTGQFEPWFQPQYNHADGTMIGAEALVRWRRDGKLVPPYKFIPVFEKNGFIYQMDKNIWEQTCACLRRWLDQGLDVLPVSVNISRQDIFCKDIFEVLTGLLDKYHLPVDLLRLEVTESAFSEASGEIVAVVNRLIDFGFTVEIDDFGSGYSSLNTLKDVPAQILKLDMKFFENTEHSQRGGNIIESVVRMAKWLGTTIIAEGVEEKAQADYLKTIGCTYIQGYLYAKPMPLAEYEERLRKEKKDSAGNDLETVDNLNNNAFWDPKSIETLIFNSYVGGACICERHNDVFSILRVNDKFTRELGGIFSGLKFGIDLELSGILDQRNQKILLENVKKAISTKAEQSFELKLVQKDHPERFAYIRNTIRLIAQTGDRCMFYCVVQNVTEQHLATRNQRRLFDNLPCGAGIYEFANGQMSLVYQNKSYWELVGLNEECFPDPSSMSAVHPEDIPVIMKELSEAIQQNRDVSCDIRLRHLTLGFRTVHLCGRIVPEKDGGFTIYATFELVNRKS